MAVAIAAITPCSVFVAMESPFSFSA